MRGVFIAKGETDPCGCSPTLMTVWLPWLSDLHDSMFNKWVSWTSTLHHIDWQQAHSGDVGNMSHDLTRHDLTRQCWYIRVAPRVHVELHCRWVMNFFMVYHSFNSAWQSARSLWWSLVRLMMIRHVAPCLHVGKLDRFIYSWKVHVHPFVSMWAHLACLLVRPSANTYLHDHPFASTSLCMHHSFILWWTYPSACAPFIHPFRCLTMFVIVLVPTVIHDETT